MDKIKFGSKVSGNKAGAGGTTAGGRPPQQATRAPQEAAAPRHHLGQTQGREPSEEPDSLTRRGFKLNLPEDVLPTVTPKADSGRPRKAFIYLAVFALLFLILGWLLSSSDEQGMLYTKSEESVLKDYRTYLEGKKVEKGEVEQRAAKAQRLIIAAAWAKALGDRQRAVDEYGKLLQMDNDSNSPLYSFSARQLEVETP
jgi:hypothetical protein